eukprot:gene3934-4910_t
MSTQITLPFVVLEHISTLIKDDHDRICFYHTCKSLLKNGQQSKTISKNFVYIRIPDILDGIRKRERDRRIRKIDQSSSPAVIIKTDDNAPESINKPNQLISKSASLRDCDIRSPYQKLLYQFSDFLTVVDGYVYSVNEFTDFFSWVKHSLVLEELVLIVVEGEPGDSTPYRIPPGFIPSSLKVLTLAGNLSTIPITVEPGSIPPSVTKLSIYHSIIKRCGPAHLIIPHTVVDLEIFGWVDERIDESSLFIPPKVTSLSIGLTRSDISFIPGCFPATIERLSLHSLDSEIMILIQEGVIPNSVKSLILYGNFKTTKLLDSVIELHIERSRQPLNTILQMLPSNLKQLTLNEVDTGVSEEFQYQFLPQTLSTIKVNGYRSFNIHPYSNSNLTAQSLELNYFHIVYLECQLTNITNNLLPPTLQSLKLNSQVNEISIGSIPPSVTKLHFQFLVSVPLVSGTLPQSLLELIFQRGISNRTSFPVLPSNLRKLKIYRNFDGGDQLIPPNALPSSLLILKLVAINQPFALGVLPPNLKTLKIRNSYSETIPIVQDTFIPNTIEHLHFPTSRSAIDHFSPIILKLLSSAERTLKIGKNNHLVIYSLDRNDSFLYYHNSVAMDDGIANFIRSFFVQESDLKSEESIDQLHQRFNQKIEKLKSEKKFNQIKPETDDFNQQIFDIVNKNNGLNVIDLHGLYQNYAIQYLEKRFKTIRTMIKSRDTKAPKDLTIITGLGNHSGASGPKLKPAIKQYLVQNNIIHTEISKGGALVVVF